MDLYANGRFQEAAKMFEQILQLDPENAAAKRAFRRVEVELRRGGR